MSPQELIVADVLRELVSANISLGVEPLEALNRGTHRLSQLMFGENVDNQSEVSLDEHIQLLRDDDECRRMVTFWQKRRAEIQDKLAGIMGEAEVGTIDGEPVFYFEPKEQFRGGDFKKKYPDLARLYTRDLIVNKFDEKAFQRERPDLWREFRVRAMRNTFSAVEPGDGQ